MKGFLGVALRFLLGKHFMTRKTVPTDQGTEHHVQRHGRRNLVHYQTQPNAGEEEKKTMRFSINSAIVKFYKVCTQS